MPTDAYTNDHRTLKTWEEIKLPLSTIAINHEKETNEKPSESDEVKQKSEE